MSFDPGRSKIGKDVFVGTIRPQKFGDTENSGTFDIYLGSLSYQILCLDFCDIK